MRVPGRAVVAAWLIAAAALGTAGCAARVAAAPPIVAGTAYVPVPQAGTTVAYVVIRNNGAADRLLAVRTSAGGKVVFLAPPGSSAAGARPVPAITVPAHSTLAMVPDGYHMMLTGVPPMRAGQDITLTLIFARARPVSVLTQVTNPATGGGSYFLN